jgi:hypothetical protein
MRQDNTEEQMFSTATLQEPLDQGVNRLLIEGQVIESAEHADGHPGQYGAGLQGILHVLA